MVSGQWVGYQLLAVGYQLRLAVGAAPQGRGVKQILDWENLIEVIGAGAETLPRFCFSAAAKASSLAMPSSHKMNDSAAAASLRS